MASWLCSFLTSSTTALAWCGSKLIKGSSKSKTRGCPISACASNKRCRSPPESSRSGRRARFCAPTKPNTLSTSARPVRPGRGSPRRWPLTTPATNSHPLSRRPAAVLRICGIYPTAGFPRVAGRSSTSIWPFCGANSPSTARISVVFPAPLGPNTPINSPGRIVKLTRFRTLRPARLS
jgi:hypothetical protein